MANVLEAVQAFLLRRRGVTLPHRKDAAPAETVDMPAPERIVLPLSQHIGAACTPCVAVGDTVAAGQVIADSDAAVSAPIHSGISGRVSALTSVRFPDWREVPAVVIDND